MLTAICFICILYFYNSYNIKLCSFILGDVLKAKWRGLRDNFRKELVKATEGRSGDAGGVKVTSKWPYFNMLLFLKDTMAQRSLKGNIPPLNIEQNIDDENSVTDVEYDKIDGSQLNSDQEDSNENNVSTMPKARFTERATSDATIPSTVTTRKKNVDVNLTVASEAPKTKKIKSSVYEKMIAIEEEKLKAYKAKSKEKSMEDDSDFHFCMSLLPYMRKLPEEKKLSVRIKMQEILLEAQQCSEPTWRKSGAAVPQNYYNMSPPYSSSPSPQSSNNPQDEGGSTSQHFQSN